MTIAVDGKDLRDKFGCVQLSRSVLCLSRRFVLGG